VIIKRLIDLKSSLINFLSAMFFAENSIFLSLEAQRGKFWPSRRPKIFFNALHPRQPKGNHRIWHTDSEYEVFGEVDSLKVGCDTFGSLKSLKDL